MQYAYLLLGILIKTITPNDRMDRLQTLSGSCATKKPGDVHSASARCSSTSITI